ncbi:MAG: hypothetical protein RR640_02560 [Oscillospiraceae bacterium]
MGKIFDSTMKSQHKLSKSMTFNKGELLILLIITLLAIYARFSLFDHTARDYNVFLSPWFDQLKNAGGFGGLGLSLGDYTPPYLYILATLTYIPVSSLMSIKMVSIIFDFILAIFAVKLVWDKWQKSTYAVFVYAAILFAPTIVFNSSMWAQCDVIFTAFIAMSIWFFFKEKPFLATIMFSISFCFKLQAIFFLPFLIVMWAKNKMKLRHFLLIPGVYLISIIPAFIAGRPLKELLTIYFNQSGQYTALNYNAPNIYTIMEGSVGKILSTAGIMVSGVVILLSVYYLWMKKFKISKDFMVTLALFFAILIPFILPRMHERYFYLADALSIIFVFFVPKRFYVAILVNLASLIGYAPYLFKNQAVPLVIGSLFMLIALIFISIDLYKQTKIEDDEVELTQEEPVKLIDDNDILNNYIAEIS